jgi:hypothetical protein
LVSKYQDRSAGSTGNKKSTATKPGTTRHSAEINRIEQQLRSLLGVKVELNYHENGSGQIRIPFKTDKELNYLLDLLDELDKD